jgi:transmembrane sensor
MQAVVSRKAGDAGTKMKKIIGFKKLFKKIVTKKELMPLIDRNNHMHMFKSFTTVEELLDDPGFRYWCNGINEEAAEEFAKWVSSNPHQQPLVTEAKNLLAAINPGAEKIPAEQAEKARMQLMTALDDTDESSTPVIEFTKKPKRMYWFAAASVIIMALAGAWFFMKDKTSIGYNTAYGQISESNLPDGSMVTLNANSSITLSKDWKKNNDREVWLKGEAFFKVSKSATKQRFIVHTDEFDIVVTGTEFNAINRNGKKAILLKEGSVILKTKTGEEVHLNPGEYFEYTGASRHVEKKEVKELNVLAWREKKLVFENTPITELVTLLNQHYGTIVTITDDNLKTKTITGILPNDNLDILVQSLEATTDFKIYKKGNELIIAKP